MTIQLTTAKALKSLTGAALSGLGLGFASSHSTQLLWFVLRQTANLLLWGAQAAGQALQTQVLGYHIFSLGCPLQLLAVLKPVLHLLGAAV